MKEKEKLRAEEGRDREGGQDTRHFPAQGNLKREVADTGSAESKVRSRTITPAGRALRLNQQGAQRRGRLLPVQVHDTRGRPGGRAGW